MRKIVLLTLVSASSLSFGQWSLRSEIGDARIERNDQRIPGAGGTNFSMNDVTGSGPFRFTRWELTYTKSADEEWRLLYAPFRVTGTGSFSGPVNFRGTTFGAGAVSGIYQFNSYRITYRRPWKTSEKSNWKFGYTLKVRDAEVTLRQGATSESELDPRGFVPLLHLSGREDLGSRFFATFDIDGLAGGPGRAFDIGAQLNYRLSDRQDLYLGLRTLEGGVDNERVYNFAWVNFVTIGITTRF